MGPVEVRIECSFVSWETEQDQALAFVLESASGPVPSLAAAIVGAPIRGSWWGHPQSQQIFKVTRAVRASKAVLVCRVIGRGWIIACVRDRHGRVSWWHEVKVTTSRPR